MAWHAYGVPISVQCLEVEVPLGGIWEVSSKSCRSTHHQQQQQQQQ